MVKRSEVEEGVHALAKCLAAIGVLLTASAISTLSSVSPFVSFSCAVALVRGVADGGVAADATDLAFNGGGLCERSCAGLVRGVVLMVELESSVK